MLEKLSKTAQDDTKVDRLEEIIQDFINVTEVLEESSDPNSDLYLLRQQAIEELL